MIRPQRVDCPRRPVVVVALDSTGVACLFNFGLGPGGLSASKWQCEDRAVSVVVLLANNHLGDNHLYVMIWRSMATERRPSC